MTATATAPRRPVGRQEKNRDPLTPEQQQLLVGCEWIVNTVVSRRVPPAMLHARGPDEFESAAWFGLVKAAGEWRPGLGTEFKSYGYTGAEFMVRSCVRDVARLLRSVRQWPEAGVDDGGKPIDPADYRRGATNPALAVWCGDDATAQRSCLDARARVILYLRAVEGLNLREIAECIGTTRERVRQLEFRARQQLLDYRNVRQVRRQVAAGRPA